MSIQIVYVEIVYGRCVCENKYRERETDSEGRANEERTTRFLQVGLNQEDWLHNLLLCHISFLMFDAEGCTQIIKTIVLVAAL